MIDQPLGRRGVARRSAVRSASRAIALAVVDVRPRDAVSRRRGARSPRSARARSSPAERRAPGERDQPRALGRPPLRWLGRVSYAWYLWHWPLVGLGAVLDRDIGVAGKLAWSAVALVLAWITYPPSSEPARDGTLSRNPDTLGRTSGARREHAAALVAHGAMNAAERRVAQPDQRAFAAARDDRMSHDCWAATVEDEKGPCEFGDATRTTVVARSATRTPSIGWAGSIAWAREHGWRIVAMVKGGCPVADMPELMHARLKRYYRECTRYREAMLAAHHRDAAGGGDPLELGSLHPARW